MNPPTELQNIDALHSVTLNPFVDQAVNSLSHYDILGFIKGVWLLLPEYAVLLMSKLFPLSFFLTILFLIAIVMVAHRIMKTTDQLNAALILPGQEKEEIEYEDAPKPIVNQKWMNVIKHINSDNPSDWKLAILECDIILGDMLEMMGHTQESIGERLKSIEKSDFTNIESAWEAHKIRNSIAHEGSEFLINEREAKRVIGLYEVVFREFDFI